MADNNAEYRKLLKSVPLSKPGIKLLDYNQLENVFPNYTSLLERIEKHRIEVPDNGSRSGFDTTQYNLMYDNVFSILGKRGSGKTSAIFSLREILRMRNGNDIIPPVVIPEMIPDGCSLIGWILALLEDCVEQLDERQQKQNRKSSRIRSMYCVEQENSIKFEYEKIKDKYHAHAYNLKHGGSYSDAVINSERQTQDSYDFAKELVVFWDTLIITAKDINANEGGREQFEPLIYIFFDDVDLRPDAVIELFSTIIKYLSHPNLIVMITADEALLLDVVETNMSERLRKPKELEMFSQLTGRSIPYFYSRDHLNTQMQNVLRHKLDLMQETSRHYSDKVLPPSRRYYLQSYDQYERKAEFIARVGRKNLLDADNDDVLTLTQLMVNKLQEFLDELELKTDNFLEYRYKDKLDSEYCYFLNEYLAFWGSTSRQLDNELLIYSDFIDRIIMEHRQLRENYSCRERYLKRLYFHMQTFMHDTLIACGLKPGETNEIHRLVEELLLFDVGGWGIYLNYLYLNDYMKEQYLSAAKRRRNGNHVEEEETLDRIYREGISLLMLMLFLENLIYAEHLAKDGVFTKERSGLHGIGILVDLVDGITPPGSSLLNKSFRDDVKSFLWYAERLLDAPSVFRSFDVVSSRSVSSYFQHVNYREDFPIHKIQMLCRDNPIWFKTHVQILYLTVNYIYSIRQRDIAFAQLDRERDLILDPFYSGQIEMLRNALINTLCDMYQERETEEEVLKQSWKEFTAVSEIEVDLRGQLKSDTLVNLWDELNEVDTREREAWYKGFVAHRKLPEEFSIYSSYSIELIEIMQSVNEEILEKLSRFRFYRPISGGIDEDIIRRFINKLANEGLISRHDRDSVILAMQRAAGEQLRFPVSSIDNIAKKLEEANNKIILDEEDYSSAISRMNNFAREIRKLAYDISDENDKENALQVCGLFRFMKDLQCWYMISFLKERIVKKDSQIDMDIVPFRALYDEMVSLLQRDDAEGQDREADEGQGGTGYTSQTGEHIDRHLISVIRRNIREAVSKYIDNYLEGSSTG